MLYGGDDDLDVYDSDDDADVFDDVLYDVLGDNGGEERR